VFSGLFETRLARAGAEQGGCFQDFLKQEVSRKGHRDVLVPCPENTPLFRAGSPNRNGKYYVNNLAGIDSQATVFSISS
jgi:hypothetical protein